MDALTSAVLTFLGSAAFVVLAGIGLARFGDELAEKTGWGTLWVGTLLVGIATSLPELTVNISAVWLEDSPGLALGNVFGALGISDAANFVALGLHALQHRGQEAAGIATYDGDHFHTERRLGLVSDNFSDADIFRRLTGSAAIGHTRYSTQGDTILRNVQPLYADLEKTGIAIAHNGNLTNAKTLRADLVRRGCIFQSTSDSEIFLQLTARSQYLTATDKLIEALKQVEGAYALTVLTPEGLIG